MKLEPVKRMKNASSLIRNLIFIGCYQTSALRSTWNRLVRCCCGSRKKNNQNILPHTEQENWQEAMAARREENKMRFDYDQETDVLHVTFGTGEPSFGEEIDDHLVLDIGIYTGTPTGFQVLHVKEAEIASVNVILRKTFKNVRNREKNLLKEIATDRRQLLQKALREFPSRAKKSLVEY